MVERCRELGAPLMAGSSIPGQWRSPFLEHAPGTDLEEAVLIGFSGLDIYGAHACDTLQAMVERRGPLAAETGVAAVQCLEGEAVWEAGRAGRFSMRLARAAANAAVEGVDDDGRETDGGRVDMEEFHYDDVLPATAFIVEYLDGFRATVLMLNGYVADHCYAACTKSEPDTIHSCEFFSQRAPSYGGTGEQAKGPIAHFSYLGRNIEEMFVTGKASWPAERTLLSTVSIATTYMLEFTNYCALVANFRGGGHYVQGILEAALQSRTQGGKRLVTDWLDVQYKRESMPPYMPSGPRPSGSTLLPWPPAKL
jgi:hypothetical protein